MKKIFFFLLLPSMLYGQVVVKDSIWQSNSNGLFYENRLVEYSNGEFSLNKRLLGDSVSIFNEYLRTFQSESNRIANLAFEARNFDKEIGAMLSRRDSVLLSLNKDLTDTIAAKSAAPLLQNGWAIFEDGASLDVVFTINNQGQLRYQITGFPARNCFF